MLAGCPAEHGFVSTCNPQSFFEGPGALTFASGLTFRAQLACSVSRPHVILRMRFCENMHLWCLGAFRTFKIGFVVEK